MASPIILAKFQPEPAPGAHARHIAAERRFVISRNFASSAGRVSSRLATAFNTLYWLTFNPTSASASS
jgi:hypothetical protein